MLTLSVVFLAAQFAIALIEARGDFRFAVVLAFFTIALFTLAYFMHKASLSWIQLSTDGKCLSSIPSWYSNKLWDDKTKTVHIDPHSELLICRRSAYGAFDGYYLIMRNPGGADQVLWSAESGISRRYWEKAAREIQQRHHLNTRLIEQRVNENGTQESNWTVDSDRMRWSNFKLVVGPMLSPWLGVAVRFATSNPLIITGVGVVLWLGGIMVLGYLYRYRAVAKQPGLAATVLFWTGQFAALYGVAVLVTNAFLHR